MQENKKYNVVRRLILLLCFIFTVPANSSEMDEKCKNKWNAGKYADNPSVEAISRWSEHDDDCADSALYHYYLGWLYRQNGDLMSAYENFAIANENPTDYEQEIGRIVAQTYFQIVLTSTENGSFTFENAKTMFDDYVRKFPDDWQGLAHYAGLLLLEGKWERVVTLSSKSLKYQENSYAYRNIAIASYQIEKHSEALEAFKKAYLLSADTVKDFDLMFVGARSYAVANEFRMARALIKQLENHVPGVEGEPTYLETIRFIDYLEIKSSL